eukprot:TRINITY_DN2249_c0_g1_i3.p1 TRINITY_DN2249_c0_g1~~TRINITY_DN2249_c0_g1_i3.p1  ORF type:complete len:209 (+),score=61.80 TRINITY_DN2249_c0_g1_i3:75-701(+)
MLKVRGSVATLQTKANGTIRIYIRTTNHRSHHSLWGLHHTTTKRYFTRSSTRPAKSMLHEGKDAEEVKDEEVETTKVDQKGPKKDEAGKIVLPPRKKRSFYQDHKTEMNNILLAIIIVLLSGGMVLERIRKLEAIEEAQIEMDKLAGHVNDKVRRQRKVWEAEKREVLEGVPEEKQKVISEWIEKKLIENEIVFEERDKQRVKAVRFF